MTAGESSTREPQRGEPSLAAFRGVVFQGEAITGKSWRRGKRLEQLKIISSLPCDGTDDATGRLTFSGASRPATAGRLASDSRSRPDGAGLRAFGRVESERDFLVTVWRDSPAGSPALKMNYHHSW